MRGLRERGERWGRMVLCGGALLLAVVLAVPGGQRGEAVGRGMKIIAHRAGAADGPENTLAALERAVAAGADMAEMDIRMTGDGVLVAIHDDNLRRTTGVEQPVDEVQYELVRRLDAGSWYAGEFAGERIPELEQILGWARGRIRLILELKCVENEQAVEKLVKQIHKNGMEAQCTLACTRLDVLQQSKELLPELETIYIGRSLPWNLELLDYVDGYSIRWDGLDREQVERVHTDKKVVYAWTVNTMEAMDQMLEVGVDGLVTDDPALAAAQTGEKRK